MDPTPSGIVTGTSREDLEIVGFNGTPRVECGRDAPLARKKSTGQFFRLSTVSLPLSYSQAEIEAFRAQGRLTLFSQAMPFPAAYQATPLILWARESFMDAHTLQRPLNYLGEHLDWQLLTLEGTNHWVACVTHSIASRLLDLWGRYFIQRAESVRVSRSGDWETIRTLADLGLCAAVDKRLRFGLYVLYATGQYSADHDLARRTFDCMVRSEFREMSWAHFEARLKGSLHGPSPCNLAEDKYLGIANQRLYPLAA